MVFMYVLNDFEFGEDLIFLYSSVGLMLMIVLVKEKFEEFNW